MILLILSHENVWMELMKFWVRKFASGNCFLYSSVFVFIVFACFCSSVIEGITKKAGLNSKQICRSWLTSPYRNEADELKVSNQGGKRGRLDPMKTSFLQKQADVQRPNPHDLDSATAAILKLRLTCESQEWF